MITINVTLLIYIYEFEWYLNYCRQNNGFLNKIFKIIKSIILPKIIMIKIDKKFFQ